jgi:hypothetical protein
MPPFGPINVATLSVPFNALALMVHIPAGSINSWFVVTELCGCPILTSQTLARISSVVSCDKQGSLGTTGKR